MTIPQRLHFCWIGPSLPWAYAFAVLSAAKRGELEEVVLHHTDLLDDSAQVEALRRTHGIRLSRIDPTACLSETARGLGLGDGLIDLYERLDKPVMRSDVLRAAILYMNGGIYADLDTITVASLLPLTEAAAFVGSEFIVWPPSARLSRSPMVLGRHLLLDLIRKVLRQMPGGWRPFRRFERFYVRRLNNAIMGAEAKSPLLAAYLTAMVDLPQDRALQPYALGPHLLNEVVQRSDPGLLVVPEPRVFSPLAPEISAHWFRTGRTVPLAAILSTETRIVHWYASVRTHARVASITPESVLKNRHRQLYSALVCSCIDTLPSLA
ncbi:glycosyl transferase [Lichenicola cladoniae]|uniref:Glycosyl transferase n=1 Tax=Lichenicola cladoniae TaxID=1484109 RepID=A0A6M8HL25_9PROT|nr:glycosyltransferase [Lichenicola cladoniae]NPD65197.1 glycosyl transferase [Acetobacteraceae bacterium]QKE88795.1 glycosyl transferase [Lichenicola cladoniae]